MKKIQDPIQLLRSEHDLALEHVDCMELAASELNTPRHTEALETLRHGLDYLVREVRAHGKTEEEILYPALGRHVPKQIIESLLDEHKELWWKMALLDDVLRRKQPPPNEVRWHVVALIDSLRRHIDRENNMIFLMTAQMLSEREYGDLAEALARTATARS